MQKEKSERDRCESIDIEYLELRRRGLFSKWRSSRRPALTPVLSSGLKTKLDQHAQLLVIAVHDGAKSYCKSNNCRDRKF